VQVIKYESETNAHAERKHEGDEHFPHATLWNRCIRMRGRRGYGNAVGLTVSGDLQFLLTLEHGVVELLVRLELLVQAAEVDFRLALLIGSATFLRIDLLKFLLALERRV